MRSVQRGPWPTGNDGSRISFGKYQQAKDPLIQRIGEYCSYCERRRGLDVEHVIPRSVAQHLETEWSNLLLACRNCNSRKSNRNDSRDGYLWPDRDDTFSAFVYQLSGRVSVSERLARGEYRKASALLVLVGLGAEESPTDKRHRERRQAWNTAVDAQGLIGDDHSRDLVVKLALATGFFSIWMAVFHDDEDMRQRLTAAFRGTRLE